MKAILEQIINVLFLFMGNTLKGYRTKIAAVTTGLLGAWGMLDKLFPDLCTNFNFLCHVADSKFYYIALMVISTATYILKKLDQMSAANL
jgi:hypothetical protein